MNLILNGIDMGKIEEYSETITNRQYAMEGGFTVVFKKNDIGKNEIRYNDEFIWLKEENK